MTTRRLSLVAATVPLFALCAMFVFNDLVSSAPRDKTPPTTPANLAVTSVTETTVALSWNAASDNSGKFSYKLKINNLSNSVYNSIAAINRGSFRQLVSTESNDQALFVAVLESRAQAI